MTETVKHSNSMLLEIAMGSLSDIEALIQSYVEPIGSDDCRVLNSALG